MQMISAAGVQVLIYSWWGKGDFTDKAARMIVNAAGEHQLKIAFLIEPYPGRTPKSICADIEYLTERFGKYPAFFRMGRLTANTQEPGTRGVFLIYDPDYLPAELSVLSDTIHSGEQEALVFLQTTNLGLVEESHADGMFAYEAVQQVSDFYPSLVKAARKQKVLFIPCVSPGFNVNRTFRQPSPLFRSRLNGKTYDDWWKYTIAANPDYVGIISFNEWHEGTQIEPAIKMLPGRQKYLSYEGAYSNTGAAARDSYLKRTARWIRIFLGE